MKKHFNFLFFFFSICVLSQKLTIRDSLNHQPIPFAEIIFDGKSYFSDSLGVFEFTPQIEASIRIRKAGYRDKTISNNEKIALLSPKFFDIQEVIIKKKNDIEYKAKQLNRSTTRLQNDLSIGFMIHGEKNKVGKIKEITIPIKRIFDNNTLVKIDFFEKTETGISNKPVNSADIIIDVNELNKRNKNKIDLTEYDIPFNESLLVSLRIIDVTGKTNNKFEEPSIQFYNAKAKGPLYFYNHYLDQWQLLSQNNILININYTISY